MCITQELTAVEVINGDPVTALMVMKSAAGYYIGRAYQDLEFDDKPWLPYSRESGYYLTPQEAQAELDAMSFEVRDCIENNALYASGALPYPE